MIINSLISTAQHHVTYRILSYERHCEDIIEEVVSVEVNLTHESLDKISSMRCEQTTLVWCEQNVQLKSRTPSVTTATPLMHDAPSAWGRGCSAQATAVSGLYIHVSVGVRSTHGIQGYFSRSWNAVSSPPRYKLMLASQRERGGRSIELFKAVRMTTARHRPDIMRGVP